MKKSQLEKDHAISRKVAKKEAKQEKKAKKRTMTGIPVSGVYGIALLFVCVSISFMAYIVIMGTEGLIPKLLTIPAVLFVVSFLMLKAVK